MSTTATVSTAPSALAAKQQPVRARFTDLLAAEWLKLRGLRSTWWTVGITLLIVWGSSVAASKADYDNMNPTMIHPPHLFAVHDAFPMEGYFTLMLAAGILGALSLCGEYNSGLIRTTTIAVPARGSVVLAKAAVQAALWTVVGAVTAVVSFVIAQSILSGHHLSIALSYPGVERAMLASTLIAPVSALTGLGIAALVRHSGASIGLTSFVLVLLPNFFASSKPWSAAIRHAFAQSAFQRLTEVWTSKAIPNFFYPATVGGSWLVYLLWPLIGVTVAVLIVRRRDV